MNAEATTRAQVPPLREGFGHPCPAARTYLGCAAGVHQHHLTPSLCRFSLKDADELSPSGIADAFGQVAVSDHTPNMQTLYGDESVCIDQSPSCLMVEVPALVFDFLVMTSYQAGRLTAALSAFLSPGEPSLGSGQGLLGFPEPAGIINMLTIAGNSEGLQAYIYTRLSITRGQGAGFYYTGKDGIPAAVFPLQGQGLGLTLQGAVEFELDSPDTRQAEFTRRQFYRQAMSPQLRISETIVALLTLEPGIASFHPLPGPAVEALECPVQTVKNILENLGVDFGVFRPSFFDFGKLGALLNIGDRHSPHVPSVPALLESGVVEFSCPFQSPGQTLTLFSGGIQAVAKGPSHLFALLLLNIVVDSCRRDVAHSAAIIRMCPQRGQLSQGWELLPQQPGTPPLDSPDGFVDRQASVAPDKETQMVRLYLQGNNFPPQLGNDLLDYLAQTLHNVSQEDSLAPLWAPHQMIDYQMGLMPVNPGLHMYKSITLSTESQGAFTTWLKPGALGPGDW